MILRQDDPVTGTISTNPDTPTVKGIKSFYQTQRLEIKRLKHPPKFYINGPRDVFRLLPNIGNLDREYILLLHLSSSNEITGIEEIAIGTLSYAPVHPRELVKGAILDSARAVIFVHNHPSGSTEFSNQDIEVARASQVAFQIYNIPMIDFIVITHDGFNSMKEVGLLPFDRADLILHYDDIIRNISEDNDPNKEPTDSDIKCNLAVMIAKETLAEHCRPAKDHLQKDHLRQEPVPIPQYEHPD